MRYRYLLLLVSLAAMAGALVVGLLVGPSASADHERAEPILPQITTTPTPCPPPTPEALVVEPVRSPTLRLEQVVTVRIGNGRLVAISSESGVAEATAVAGAAHVRVPLLPNTTHNLEVAAEVFAAGGPGGCTYNYTLWTQVDRSGRPLRITQLGNAMWLPLVRR